MAYKPSTDRKDKSQRRPKPNLKDVDWARLAAYLDGEGTIRIASQKRRGRDYMWVEVSVHNADPRLIQWCLEHFGGCLQRESKAGPRRKHVIYRWFVTCSVAHEVLLGCLPYFVIKRNQAEIAISFRSLTVSPERKWGVKGMPQELKDMQYAFKRELQKSKTLHYEELVH